MDQVPDWELVVASLPLQTAALLAGCLLCWSSKYTGPVSGDQAAALGSFLFLPLGVLKKVHNWLVSGACAQLWFAFQH